MAEYAQEFVFVPRDCQMHSRVGASCEGMDKSSFHEYPAGGRSATGNWIGPRSSRAEVGPLLREMGLLFGGIDVIGGYLTEINVTSPTGIRELDKACGINIADQLLDTIATQLHDT